MLDIIIKMLPFFNLYDFFFYFFNMLTPENINMLIGSSLYIVLKEYKKMGIN